MRSSGTPLIRPPETVPWNAQDVQMAAVGMQVGGQDAGRVGGRQHHRAGAVAEQHAGGAGR